MLNFSRREFLGASLAQMAAARLLVGDDKPTTQPAAKPTDDAPFQPDTLFLTWQRDPTTTMTVQWVGAAGQSDDTQVYFLPATDANKADANKADANKTDANKTEWAIQPTVPRPYPMSELSVFRAELTGLLPGTDYQFRIGKKSPTYRFRTMPAKATNSFQFISGGDCGTNAHAVANNIQAARQDPMFAVVGGDLGYDDGKSLETSLKFLRNYSKHMIARNGRMIPLIPCIGNHEVTGGFNQPRTKAPFYYALFDGLFPDTGFATLDFGDYLSLVLLDSGHTTPIGGGQADWLETTLKARADHPNVFAVNHVPAYPSFRNMSNVVGAGTGEENRRFWVPLFEKYRVPVVLEHHDHTFKRTKPLLNGLAHDNGVLYLGDGSWGQLRIPKTPEQLPHMVVTSGEYHLSLHRIQGAERFHLALDEFGRVMDVSRTGQRSSGIVGLNAGKNS